MRRRRREKDGKLVAKESERHRLRQLIHRDYEYYRGILINLKATGRRQQQQTASGHPQQLTRPTDSV